MALVPIRPVQKQEEGGGLLGGIIGGILGATATILTGGAAAPVLGSAALGTAASVAGGASLGSKVGAGVGGAIKPARAMQSSTVGQGGQAGFKKEESRFGSLMGAAGAGDAFTRRLGELSDTNPQSDPGQMFSEETGKLFGSLSALSELPGPQQAVYRPQIESAFKFSLKNDRKKFGW